MLTRLKVSGFKNLVDVDVRFGPFTCVAGPNGAGKSNLFDAIRFLSALANDTLIDAALSVRAEGGRTADIRNIFHHVGNKYTEEMSFEAEMIIPQEGKDDLGQSARASITFLRYTVVLAYRVDENLPSLGSLELVQEGLGHIKLGDAPKHLLFDHQPRTWRKSVLQGRRTTPFIATKIQGKDRIITLSQDRISGRPKSIRAASLPRTVLSTVNAAESPTALLARREMQSWRLLQLEPASLREPDQFATSPGLGIDGSHLPATLYYLARSRQHRDSGSEGRGETWVYDQAAARLSELIDDVYIVNVDRDERKELLTLEVTDRDGTVYPARSLSDGTLRFLALAVLELDPEASGVICLEEPENGIHPARIPAILRLLQDIATDVDCEVGLGNPLRQVIVNTHSPAVVNQVPDDSLLVAELREMIKDGQRFKSTRFSWLPDTWRAKGAPDVPPVARGKLLAYLNPIMAADQLSMDQQAKVRRKKSRRVVDRTDLQPMLLSFGEPQ